MLRTRLLTATAAIALFGAGAAFAQDVPTPSAPPTAAPATAPEAAPPATATDQTTPATSGTIVDVLRARGEFTTLLTALDAAQLTETLTTQPAISIFAPTDAAFAALPEAARARLMDPANVNELRQRLLYHVVVADVQSSQIEGARGGVETAARSPVLLDGTGSSIMVDEATVTTADLDASNGAVFIIDRVLDPASSQAPAAATPPAATTPPAAAAPPAGETTAPAESPAPAPSMEGDDMDNDPAATEGVPTPATGDPVPAEPDSMAPTPTPPSTGSTPPTPQA